MAKYSMGEVIERANEMIDDFSDLRVIQRELDSMSRLDWHRPAGLEAAWMRDFKTTAPFDAVKAGVRVLSGLDEDITIDPYAFEEYSLGDYTGAKQKANRWETVLKWQMDRAARRRAILRQDVVRSALMYDEIVGQIVHLPTQIKTISKLGGNPNRQKAALRYGDFAVLLRNPQTVYTKYSDYMLEAVLYASIKSPQDIQAFWNNKELAKLIEDDEAADQWVLFDYVDFNSRVVFCYPGNSVGQIKPGGIIEKDEKELPAVAIELLNEEWKMDFLPWAAVIGGTQLNSAPENARFPLLYGIHKSDQWNNTNIIGTLLLSEAIAEAARPDVARKGIMPDSVEATYGEPGGTWDVPAGHDIQDMPQKGLDPALREALDRQISDMGRATIPQVLVSAEMAPNEPFAGFNLRIQQAMGSLMPYKFLAERWFEDAYGMMLNWAKESGNGIRGYGENKETQQLEEFKIEADEIDKSRIYLSVNLEADIPIDRQQRMATAVQASQQLKMPTRDILEMLGETDPERKIKEWTFEQMDMAYLGGVVQQIQFEASQQIEAAIKAAQEAAFQQVMEQAQQGMAQQQQGGGGGQPGPVPGPEGGIPGVGGPGFDPNQGGIPPATANPNATREGQTGQTRTGEEVLA
jgi:hypothetical protein